MEELLGGRFVKPFSMVQVPDDAPEEIPRIQAKSINNHSHLSIAQSNISLVTNFDNGWENDWSKCLEYLKSNQDLLYSISDNISSNPLLYCGLTITLFFPFPEEKQVMEHVNKVFFPGKKLDNLHEFNLRFVHRLKEIYFINYTYSSTIKYLLNNVFIRPIPAYLTPTEYGLTLNIDINDRYGSNFQKEYISDKNTGHNLIEYMDIILTKKIDNLFKNGDFEL
ncbi:hypothetical protein [Leptospira alexanderi]|uniref:hypothetical protein n=1 Tax=Leptospira alexanderi TaxID=100053 RepID=UPI001FD5EE8D|nr:hypothetical protein [Leptospira alexanderi]